MHILKKSIAYIQNSRGQISTGNIHREFSISERQFERIFRFNVGISPKRFVEIARLNYAISIISKNSNLTETAYEAGYYDQSHFIRSFKFYTGMTPGEFRDLSKS
jgi:AraC-like DNA-binding protein